MTTERQRELARDRQRRHRAGASQWLRDPGKDSSKGNVPINNVLNLGITVPKMGLRIGVVPDPQCMSGVNMQHLKWCGEYFARKQPDVIVALGDWGDFPSLSMFGSKMEFEGKRYKKDLAAFHQGMELFMEPISKVPAAQWNPWREFIDGNHEGHIERTVNNDPKLEGLMSLDDLKLKDYGWREHAFLQPINIGGVAFCHYFPSGIMGRPITTAPQLLSKLHMSAVAGHQQGREIAFGRRADGGNMTAIITGSFYQHNYKYLSPFTNRHWRGMLMMHEVRDGSFDEMFVSINFLKRKFA